MRPLVDNLLRISTQLQQSIKSNGPFRCRAPCKSTGYMPVKPDLLGTTHASSLVEQEVPGAKVLYEAENDTSEGSRGQIICHAQQPGLCNLVGSFAKRYFRDARSQWRLQEENTAAVAITLAREAQILNPAFAVGMSETDRPEK